MNKTTDGKVMAASVTPLNSNTSIDTVRFAEHSKNLLKNGCDGVVLFGTTGEGNSFAVAERMNALDSLLSAGISGEQLMVGTGCCSLTDTVELTRHAIASGVHKVLVLPPFYYKAASDEGLYEYFSQLVESTRESDLRMYLYHFPKMAIVAFSHELIAKLSSRFPQQIVGIKDSTGDREHTMRLNDAFPSLEVYAGSEMFLLDYLRAGGNGCISATTNITTKLAASIRDDIDAPSAISQQSLLSEVRGELQKFPLTGAIKGLLAVETGYPDWGRVRAPLNKLPLRQVAELRDTLRDLGFYS